MAKKGKIRYAVVGLGHIAQVAVLPAFQHTENSEVVALVSGDREKMRKVAGQWGIKKTRTYEEYEEFLKRGEVDAAYIATPNSLHRKHTELAAHAGVNVLCEKPMAVTSQDCQAMIKACEENNVKLMIAYRLHFEEANLSAIEVGKSGKLGDLRFFSSDFAMQVKPGNIRVQAEKGGGTMYDIGVYCINAARYLFQDDPVEAVAFSANNGDSRFAQVDEMTSAILKFPNERLASFTCSFGAADVATYTLMGTKGRLRLEPAYEYVEELKQYLTVDGKTEEKTFSKRDQFAAEIIYFSGCVLNDKEPEPGGAEGMIDVQIVEAIYRSAQTRQPVKIEPFVRDVERPTMKQEIQRPPVEKPELVGVEAPSE